MTTAVVRYGAMGMQEECALPKDARLRPGTDVVVRTPRGVEWGTVVKIMREGSGDGESSGDLLRPATAEDYEKQREIEDRREPQEYTRCKELIRKHKLPMKLRAVEHLFGGHKIIFYFLSDGRVDFRGLVRDLASEYRTRIEMRHIGVRDEARMMGLVGPCGRELCCQRFLLRLKPVPMKLAKNQKSTLDPAKISGRCGRLKCCLRFEEQQYRDMKANLPRRGAPVNTPHGRGAVVDYEILSQTVTVELEGGVQQKVPLADLEVEE